MCGLLKGLEVRVLAPSCVSCLMNLNWYIELPSIEEVDPKYFDRILELCIFISLFILFSHDWIIIDGMLLLLIMFGVPSSLNCQDIMYTSYLSISSLSPEVYRRCSHVWAACCNFSKYIWGCCCSSRLHIASCHLRILRYV